MSGRIVGFSPAPGEDHSALNHNRRLAMSVDADEPVLDRQVDRYSMAYVTSTSTWTSVVPGRIGVPAASAAGAAIR